MKPTKKVYKRRGVTMHYFVVGKGRPLLFLHGAGLTPWSYEEIISRLSENFLVIAPEIPCFGKSSTPIPVWDYKNFADFFCGFLQFLKIKKAVVVGHSFGGGIALMLGARCKKVSHAIVLNPAFAPLTYPSLKFLYIYCIKKTAFDLAFSKNRSGSLRMILDFVMTVLRRFADLPYILKTIRHCLSKTYPLPQKMPPTLMLWGENDELYPANCPRDIQKKILHARIFYLKGNHDCYLYYTNNIPKIISVFVAHPHTP